MNQQHVSARMFLWIPRTCQQRISSAVSATATAQLYVSTDVGWLTEVLQAAEQACFGDETFQLPFS
jgi:hypothetical protein